MATPHQNSLNLLFSLSFAILRGNQNWSVLNFAIFFYSFFYVALASDLKGGKFDDCTSEILKSLETEDRTVLIARVVQWKKTVGQHQKKNSLT